MLALLAIAFHQKLTDRYQGLRNDVSQYQDNNSVSSIGSRLAMFQSGLQAALDAPFGESAERRNDNIKRQERKNQNLPGRWITWMSTCITSLLKISHCAA